MSVHENHEYRFKLLIVLLCIENNSRYRLLLNEGVKPANAAEFGYQPDTGEYCLAVAHTLVGNIPGKARGDHCWYVDPVSHEEERTGRFSWVVETTDCSLWLVDAGSIKTSSSGYVVEGFLKDRGSAGRCWSAVARTQEWGTIPGYTHGTRCRFSYGCEVFETESFYVVVGDHRCVTAELGLAPSASSPGHVAIPRPLYRPSLRAGYVYEFKYEPGGELISDGCLRRNFEDAVIVVGQWDFHAVRAPERPLVKYTSGDVQLSVTHELTHETDRRRRYAELCLDADDLECRQRLATVFVELDVDFGRALITRALTESLESVGSRGRPLAVRLSQERIPLGRGEFPVTQEAEQTSGYGSDNDENNLPLINPTSHRHRWILTMTCGCAAVATAGLLIYGICRRTDISESIKPS